MRILEIVCDGCLVDYDTEIQKCRDFSTLAFKADWNIYSKIDIKIGFQGWFVALFRHDSIW